MRTSAAGDGRLLTFEIGNGAYALPISGVVEVTEVERVSCVPTLPRALGGVINFHGDALPVIRPWALLGLEPDEARDPELLHVLAVTDRPSDTARLGVPVDRVLGLVNGPAAVSRGRGAVAERRSIEGRVTNVLDPRRVVQQARDAIEQTLGRGDT